MLVAALSSGQVQAAFEPVPESPWLQGGAASCLFPRTPLAMLRSPVAVGLLEGGGVAASASRPFGLRRLDRTALAGSLTGGSWAAGLALSLTGDGAYTEGVGSACIAWREVRGLALGAGVSLGQVCITGYGRTLGASASLAAAWTPAPGVYMSGSAGGLLRSRLGDSESPAGPFTLDVCAGVVPSEGVTVAAGLTHQELLPPELSLTAGFSPAGCLHLGAGVLTSPTRLHAEMAISLGRLEAAYGYGAHPDLPGSNIVCMSWGGCAASPEPVSLRRPAMEGETESVTFPLDVNDATPAQLECIPGIGPARAAAIAAWVRENGPVTDVGVLEDVPGIGPVLLEVLREHLEVGE